MPLLAAPFVGSFLGVLARRLPLGQPVMIARSRCESCGGALSPWELAPIVSYLIQRGRCRQCGGSIAPAHLAIELAATLVAAWAATTDTDPGWLWADCALGWTLLALAWIDWVHLRLPDALTLPLVLGGLGATALLDPAETTGHALAAAIGYAAFRLIARGYRALRGREGLGTGDAKLLAASGAWVGVAGLSPVVLAAAVAGLVVAVVRTGRAGRLSATTMVPFGPCLALATWLVRLYG